MRVAAAIILVLMMATSCSSANSGPVKEPAVAGAFYPADPAELGSMIDGFLANAPVSNEPGRLAMIISPHAGYIYSGHVAAHGYKQLIGRSYKTVVVIGQSHRESFDGVSVYTEGSFRTPLGLVPIDTKRARALIDEKAGVRFYPKAFAEEHSVEVQIPFLQRTLKDFKIVPVLMGNPTRASYDRVVEGLTALAASGDALIVVSTDLSHYHADAQARAMDAVMYEAFTRVSPEAARQALGSGKGEMCGVYAVLSALEAARRSDVTKGILYKYANSGDTGGDRGRVVGYASVGLYQDPLTEAEKRELLALAKGAITEHVRTGEAMPPKIANPKFLADGAVFVTINRNGRLRGCIGHVIAMMPLYQSIIENAEHASSRDPRFKPMTPEELSDMEVEVSVLSPMKPIRPEDVKVGTHGLLIQKGPYSGVFLPQVPVEWGWNREQYLDELCGKAGMSAGCWRSGASLMGFTAEVIKEH